MRHYSFLKEPGAPREMGPFWLAFPLQTRCLRISGDPFLAMKTPFCGKVWPSFRVAADGLAGSERGPSGAEAAADLPPFRGQPRPVRGLESGPPAPVPRGKVFGAAWDPASENPSQFLVVHNQQRPMAARGNPDIARARLAGGQVAGGNRDTRRPEPAVVVGQITRGRTRVLCDNVLTKERVAWLDPISASCAPNPQL